MGVCLCYYLLSGKKEHIHEEMRQLFTPVLHSSRVEDEASLEHSSRGMLGKSRLASNQHTPL